ncbi:MAG TPA: hypothetical protein VFQ92_21230 [Blastocatellia bacterium]|nr:hypothetical protein [Blastocatellia bacterium]
MAAVDDGAIRQAVNTSPSAFMAVGAQSKLDAEAARRVSQLIGLLMGTTEFQRKQ